MLRLHGEPGAASSHPADVLGAAVGGGDALGGDALEAEQRGISSISARRSIPAKSGRERSRDLDIHDSPGTRCSHRVHTARAKLGPLRKGPG